MRLVVSQVKVKLMEEVPSVVLHDGNLAHRGDHWQLGIVSDWSSENQNQQSIKINSFFLLFISISTISWIPFGIWSKPWNKTKYTYLDLKSIGLIRLCDIIYRMEWFNPLKIFTAHKKSPFTYMPLSRRKTIQT